MNKDTTIKLLGVLLIIAGANWYVDSHKLKETQAQVRTEQVAKNKATAQVEDLSADKSDLTDENKELKDSETHIKDGQQIKNNKFALEYEDDGDGDYAITVYPNKKKERLIAQQGDGARGLEIVNVSKNDKRVTSAK